MAESTNQPPAEDRIFTDESFAAELFWEKNRQTILVGLAVAVIVGAGVLWWAFSLHNTKLAAQAFFAQATTPAAWREVMDKYPGSQPAADAAFLLADALRTEGKFDEAVALYQKFLSDFPQHPLVGGARLGIAETYAAQGKTNEALAALRVAETSGGYAAPFAGLLEGRTLVREGRYAEANTAFSKVMTSYQSSPIARIAIRQIEEIEPLLAAKGGK